MLRSRSSARPRMKNVLNWLSSSGVDQLGLLGDGDEADLELAALTGDTGEHVDVRVGRLATSTRCASSSTTATVGMPACALAVVEERLLPRLEHAARQEAGDEQLLGGVEPAGVDEHDLAFAQVALDRGGHRHVAVGADRVEVADAPGAAVQHLQRGQGHGRPRSIVAEADEVVELAERQQPRDARVLRGRRTVRVRTGPRSGRGTCRPWRCAGRRRSSRPG